jgi:Holliday junction resolvase RusA-like endonuclease
MNAADGRAWVHNYTPKKHPVTQWKSDVKTAAIKAWYERYPGDSVQWDGPVWMIVAFYLPRPQSLCRKKDPEGDIPCTSKPDIENLAKSLMDSLSGVIFCDDKQVCELRLVKNFHEKGGRPRAEIMIGQKK